VLALGLAMTSGGMNGQDPYNGSTDTRADDCGKLQTMQKSSVRIEYDVRENAEAPAGASKIGGKPDLPPGFEWFYDQGKSLDGISENRPLSFLAQINCEEASRYDQESLLPSKGMLYFFYEFATMTWGFDPKDKGSARVYYFQGDPSTLRRTDVPSDLPEEYQIPEMAVSFSSAAELPDFDEFIELCEGFRYQQRDGYDQAKSQIIPASGEGAISKLLGYANLIQNGMLLECELASSGVYVGGPEGFANVSARQREESKKWQLLFQLDSIQTERYELHWGDGGRIYFYIRMDDLKALNFEDCWLILQCY